MSLINSGWLIRSTTDLHSSVTTLILAVYLSSWFGLAAAVFIHLADAFGYIVGITSGVIFLILALFITGKTLLYMKSINGKTFTIFTSMTGRFWTRPASDQRVFGSRGATLFARVTGLIATFVFLFSALLWMGVWAMIISVIRFWIL